MPASTVPVQVNDDLRVSVSTLTEEPVRVEWTQNFGSKKTDTYYAVISTTPLGVSDLCIGRTCTVLRKLIECANPDNDPGRLFIASRYVDQFKSSSQLVDNGSVYSFKVTDRFRYGEDNTGQNRFIVLHDTSNKIFQHRFASNSKIRVGTKLGDMLTGMMGGRGKDEVNVATDLISSKFGDELRKF
ncbi:hypothetical protein V8F20_007955 [Naviculisporaceae sp. PSN 640]